MFKDRVDAGRQLVSDLKQYSNENTLILALPRGGVVVADEIAKELKLPLDVIIARKLGAPFNEEFGFGAISEDGAKYINERVVKDHNISAEYIKNVIESETIELKRRVALYRKGREIKSKVNGKNVLLVDDGIATGVTCFAAIEALKKMKARTIVLVVPVCAKDTYAKLKPLVDKIVCPIVDENLTAVGNYYKDFAQVTDEEVGFVLNKRNGFLG